jgi:hypothetical protein
LAPTASPTFTGTVSAAGITATGSIRADSGGADGGFIIRPWTAGSSYESLATNNMAASEYVVLSDGTSTFIGAGTGGATTIRSGANNATNEIVVSDSNATIRGARLGGVVGGTGTTSATANLTVTHGLGVQPSAITATIHSNTFTAARNQMIFTSTPGTPNTTTFTVYASSGSAGIAATFSWIAVK